MLKLIGRLIVVGMVAAACGTAAPAQPSASSAAPTASLTPTASPATTPAPLASAVPSPDRTAAATRTTEPAAPTGTVDLAIANFVYDPTVMTVRAGTTVRWTNQDPTGHTVTSGPPDQPDGMFDSGVLEEGMTYEQTFDDVGVFEFFCNLHPRMTGQVEVSP